MSDQDEAEDHLSEEEIDQQFREMADKFIDLANDQAERVNRERAAEYFRGQYQSMLDEYMRDYREAFETLPYAHLMPDKSS